MQLPCHFPRNWGVMGNLEPSENLEARMDLSSRKVHMAFFHGREYEKRQNPFPYTWSRCFENSHHFNLAMRQSALKINPPRSGEVVCFFLTFFFLLKISNPRVSSTRKIQNINLRLLG